jgi:branched-chain amino acid transport system ATP-binding protein
MSSSKVKRKLSGRKKSAKKYPLKVEKIGKKFGGISAVNNVSFSVEKGSITGLIGPNGAGKSTTFDLITGVTSSDTGVVKFNGEDITRKRPYQIANIGLVRTFQITRELKEMTVMENVMLAPKNQMGEQLSNVLLSKGRKRVESQEEEMLEKAWETLDIFHLDKLANEYAGNLSGGQRKLLEMARVMMMDPSMILLDEPMAGVNPTLKNQIITLIKKLSKKGYTFLLVEHDMDVVMNHCNPIIVMHNGGVILEGTPSEISTNERVIDAYLGGSE